METSFLNLHLLEHWPILVGAFAAYLVAASIYRLYFHPLSGFPGPKLAGLTWYYQGYYELLLDGGLIDQLEILHKQYGAFKHLELCRRPFPHFSTRSYREDWPERCTLN